MRRGYSASGDRPEPRTPPAGGGQMYAHGVDPAALPMRPMSAPPPLPPPAGGRRDHVTDASVRLLAEALLRLADAIEGKADG